MKIPFIEIHANGRYSPLLPHFGNPPGHGVPLIQSLAIAKDAPVLPS
jgi:hypothetical protein